MYLQWNLAQCQYLLIEQQTAQFTHEREAMVKLRNLDGFPLLNWDTCQLPIFFAENCGP